MASLEEIYHQLTGVDIKQQKELWDERGKGYWGEYLVFQELYPFFPGSQCKILMNVEIPTPAGKTTEIDLLFIHETGIYVFEIKHYKGTIYGQTNDPTWTQYFRTTENHCFQNPILQNQYHIDALRRIFPNVPLHSVIVFTNPYCDLRLLCNEPFINICALDSLRYQLEILCSGSVYFSGAQLDSMFRTLLPYSHVMQQVVTVNGKEIPFHQYISTLSSGYSSRMQQLNTSYTTSIQQLENNYKKQKKRFKGSLIAAILTAASTTLLIIGICIAICVTHKQQMDAEVNAAHEELNEFKQKFEFVGPYNNGEITIANPLVTASNVSLTKSRDLAKTVKFSCTLNWTGQDYGVRLTNDTKYIIILKDGTIQEYDLFTSDFPCYPSHKLGKNYHTYLQLPEREFYNLNPSDIAYIKLSNTEIWRHQANHGNSLFSGYDIMLYSAI